ncbi:MAG: hypothetical protein B6U73_02665, partial [Desulfurococcales archaeon ex4484_204]
WIRWRNSIPGMEFKQSGYLWLITREEDLVAFKKLEIMLNSLGIPAKLIDRDKVKELVRFIELNDVVAAMYDPMAGKSLPYRNALMLRRELLKRGVRIFEHSPVRGLRVGGGRVTSIDVEGVGEVYLGKLVVASGYWSREILAKVGIEIPVVAEPHHLLITEKLRYFLEPLVIHLESSSYLVQTESGGVIMGTDYDVPEGDLSLHLGFARKVVLIIVKYFPQLEDVNILRIWTGYYVRTPDRHPIVGYVPGFENVVVAMGFSGHGYMMAPVIGREVANLVIYGRPSMKEVELMDLGRFEEGRLLKEELVFG